MTLSRNKSPDLRVVKTHKAIREAFIILLSEQEYNDIAIQAILERAKVNVPALAALARTAFAERPRPSRGRPASSPSPPRHAGRRS